jgi:hypothetical protein
MISLIAFGIIYHPEIVQGKMIILFFNYDIEIKRRSFRVTLYALRLEL